MHVSAIDTPARAVDLTTPAGRAMAGYWPSSQHSNGRFWVSELAPDWPTPGRTASVWPAGNGSLARDRDPEITSRWRRQTNITRRLYVGRTSVRRTPGA